MDLVGIVFILAAFNKAVWDYVATAIRKVKPDVNLWFFDFLALVTGILIAWGTRLNILSAIPGMPDVMPVVAMLFTGIGIGGGTVLLNVLFNRLQIVVPEGEFLPPTEEGVVQYDIVTSEVAPRHVGW